MENHKKKVLIAHQSTIPHYRIPFYEALQRQKPGWWDFDVVCEPWEMKKNQRYISTGKKPQFSFSVLPAILHSVQVNGKVYGWQNFFWKARNYDLIVVEDGFNNLTYLLCWVYKIFGKKIAFWGHGQNRSLRNPRGIRRMMEAIKVSLGKKTDCYFAYTAGVKRFLQQSGVEEGKIIALMNTVDIYNERAQFCKKRDERLEIRRRLHVEKKKVLLFVGRIKPCKRLEVLLEALMSSKITDMHCFVIGDGISRAVLEGKYPLSNVEFLGAETDQERLSDYYVASDLFVLPGAVGLGPLQAACYDLPTLTIKSYIDGPEAEYLSDDNSVVLEESSSNNDFLEALDGLIHDDQHLRMLRKTAWSSISHLGIAEMAGNFIKGVNQTLKQG